MHNINDWFYFIGALDKNTCNKIRNVAKNKWKRAIVHVNENITDEERITGITPIPGINKNIRISGTMGTNDQWIYDTIFPYMEEANEQAGWKYDIRAAEGMQLTRYKKGEFYNFHKDGLGDYLSAYDQPENEFLHGHVRKLSMSVLLNDNYEGGEFQFATYKQEKCTIDTPPEFNKIGSIIMFPSDMEHRVTPVTKGIRYSLVVWFLGPPFR